MFIFPSQFHPENLIQHTATDKLFVNQLAEPFQQNADQTSDASNENLPGSNPDVMFEESRYDGIARAALEPKTLLSKEKNHLTTFPLPGEIDVLYSEKAKEVFSRQIPLDEIRNRKIIFCEAGEMLYLLRKRLSTFVEIDCADNSVGEQWLYFRVKKSRIIDGVELKENDTLLHVAARMYAKQERSHMQTKILYLIKFIANRLKESQKNKLLNALDQDNKTFEEIDTLQGVKKNIVKEIIANCKSRPELPSTSKNLNLILINIKNVLSDIMSIVKKMVN